MKLLIIYKSRDLCIFLHGGKTIIFGLAKSPRNMEMYQFIYQKVCF